MPQAPQAHVCTHDLKMLIYPSSIFETSNWGSKIKILSWNFYGKCEKYHFNKIETFESLILHITLKAQIKVYDFGGWEHWGEDCREHFCI
jgi:hypothetical protein